MKMMTAFTHDTFDVKPVSKFWPAFWTIFWIILIILLVLKFFVFQQVTVIGQSMEPNYSTGELLMVKQIDKKYVRGQVVAVYEDKDVAKTADYWTRFQTRFFLKRIIGLPGESVEMIGGKVIIYNNDHPKGLLLQEDYVSQIVKDSEDLSSYYYQKTTIAENEFFVLGDNRTNSTDSRIKGAFPDYAIFGQESFKFWPFTKSAVFKAPDYPAQEVPQSVIDKITLAKKRLQIIDNG